MRAGLGFICFFTGKSQLFCLLSRDFYDILFIEVKNNTLNSFGGAGLSEVEWRKKETAGCGLFLWGDGIRSVL